MNLFAQKYTGQRMDFTGNAGFKFTPEEALSVTALVDANKNLKLL